MELRRANIFQKKVEAALIRCAFVEQTYCAMFRGEASDAVKTWGRQLLDSEKTMDHRQHLYKLFMRKVIMAEDAAYETKD